MRKLGIALTLACLTLTVAVATAGDKAWFDLENCGMCKNMMAETGLMENMEWETHVIASGMMSITVVDPAYAEAFQRANKNMEKAHAAMMKGEQTNLCGFCQSYGSLFQAGATMEKIEINSGQVMLVTSSDAKLVKKIHAHAETTISEFKKMKAGDHSEAHEGHGH